MDKYRSVGSASATKLNGSGPRIDPALLYDSSEGASKFYNVKESAVTLSRTVSHGCLDDHAQSVPTLILTIPGSAGRLSVGAFARAWAWAADESTAM